MDQEAVRKRVQRAAYDTYQRLHWRLHRLPPTDAEYAALCAQT